MQTMIDALPTVSELDGMTADELDAAYDDIQAAYNAYEALNAEQQAQITGADFEALLGWFNSQTAPLADAKSGVHTHCVCGKDSSTTVNGHTHSTNNSLQIKKSKAKMKELENLYRLKIRHQNKTTTPSAGLER